MLARLLKTELSPTPPGYGVNHARQADPSPAAPEPPHDDE